MSIPTVKHISVIGLGKLGSPLLAVLAGAGYEVIGVDTNPDTVVAINDARAPVREPGLQELLTQHKDRYQATMDTREAVLATECTFVIVPTPSGDNGAFTLEYVEPVARAIGEALRDKDTWHLVAITSTVMPGQTAEIARIIEDTSGKRHGEGFGLCYNPTFIALGSVVQNLIDPDYVLIGAENDQEGQLVELIHHAIAYRLDSMALRRMERMNWVNAEITKLANNAFVTTKITFANELGRLCEAIPGANVDVVTRALGCDTRIGKAYLKAGTAYGGPCFPRDNAAIRQAARDRLAEYGELADMVDKLNRYQASDLIFALPGPVDEPHRVGVLGLAYKPGTDCIEESASVHLVEALLAFGHSITVYDPLALENARAVWGNKVQYANSARDLIAGVDVVFLMHDKLPFHAAVLRGKTVIDPWRIVEGLGSDSYPLPNNEEWSIRDDCTYIPLGIGPQPQEEPCTS